jgi:hypothetical protein
MCKPEIQPAIFAMTRAELPLEQYRPIVTVKYLPDFTLLTTLRGGATSLKRCWPEFPAEHRWANDLDEIFQRPVVVVLRDPLQRRESTIKLIETRFTDRSEITGLFMTHAMPWLHHIKDRDFRVIPFDRLEDYLPERHGYPSVETCPLTRDSWPLPIDAYQGEMELYRMLMGTRDELQPPTFPQG